MHNIASIHAQHDVDPVHGYCMGVEGLCYSIDTGAHSVGNNIVNDTASVECKSLMPIDSLS